MLIKFLLNGKTIDLTSDIIKIQSESFSVDETGKVKATAGEIGGFTTTENEFSSDLYSAYVYSQTDLDKIRDYIMGTVTLTAEEIELYDVDKNGIVDSVDFMMLSLYIGTNTSQENPGKVSWTNGDVFNTYTIKDGTGETIVNLNAFRNYIKTLFSKSITTERINAGNIQAGIVTMTPVANEPTSIDIVFDTEFSEVPKIVATPNSAVPGTKVTGIGVTERTTEGFTLWVTRTNNTATSIMWIAIE